MVKEEKPVLLKTVLIIIGVLVIEAAAIAFVYSSKSLTGFSVLDLPDAYKGFSQSTGIFCT